MPGPGLPPWRHAVALRPGRRTGAEILLYRVGQCHPLVSLRPGPGQPSVVRKNPAFAQISTGWEDRRPDEEMPSGGVVYPKRSLSGARACSMLRGTAGSTCPGTARPSVAFPLRLPVRIHVPVRSSDQRLPRCSAGARRVCGNAGNASPRRLRPFR